jgi:cyclophilin family peptidyl-prolyl cis-trans isomerase
VSKAKTIARGAARAAEDDVADVHDPWRGRLWMAILILGVVVAVVLGAGLAVDQALNPSPPAALSSCITSTQIGPHTFIGRQPICILPSKKYQATVNTTQGQVVIQLLPEIAPVTVNNFVVLAVNEYYNGLTFWDSESWVVQGGDPSGNGRGGPGYTLPDEPNTTPTWDLGAVGMARVPTGPVNGSQFFIEKAAWPGTGPTATYNRFGTVVLGMDKAQVLTSTDRITSITIKVG